jgi:hypothetical protein
MMMPKGHRIALQPVSRIDHVPSVIQPLNATCMQCMLIHQQGAASRIGVTSIAAAYAIQGERAMAACRMQTQPEA